MRCGAARARSIACSLRIRALRLRPAIFLRMCSLQGRDDVKEVVSLLLVHFDLPHPSVRVCLGDHPLCLSKLRLVDFQEADIRAKVSAVQAGVRMGHDNHRRLSRVYGWEEKKTKASWGGNTVDYKMVAGRAVRRMSTQD